MKRFTETDKWRDSWFRRLPSPVKLLWLYLVDNCDPAGVIEIDWDLAVFQIGSKVSENDMTHLSRRVGKLASGKWIIHGFVAFQYGKLSVDCKPHAPVFAAIKRHGLTDADFVKGTAKAIEGLGKGFDTPKDKEKDKDKETEKDKDSDPAIPVELDTPAFKAAWEDWKSYRRTRRLPVLKQPSIVAQLNQLAEWGEAGAIASIRDSIRQNWQGLFEPKATGGKQTTLLEERFNAF